MTNLYNTLAQIRARLPQLTSTDDDTLLLDALEDASRALDGACHRHFYPKIATRNYDYQEATLLKLDDGEDLLAATTLTTDNGDTTIVAADFFLMCGGSYNVQPFDRIVINGANQAEFGWSDTKQKANSVVGVFGYHNDYTNAYLASGATVNETFTGSDTTLTVSDGTKFERGQTIQIESEWLYISAISSNDLTVQRAMNGSTAASHANGTAITIFRPMRDVQRVAIRLAAWLYKQYESPFTFELQVSADGTVVIPPNAPPSVHQFVRRYRRML